MRSRLCALLALALAPAAMADDAQVVAAGVTFKPILTIAGGLKGEWEQPPPGQVRDNRVTTLVVSRFGATAQLNEWISAESEFEANAGLHGASAWEGQAALSVRNQLVRVHRGAWVGEVGRVTDEASLDFFSANVADMLITDQFTRDPLLYSGFNRGNGIRGTFEPLTGLRFGLTFNAANPVSTTGSLVTGGAYPPFDRYYLQPYQSVSQVANHLPDDSFHLMMLTPSLLFDNPWLEVRAEYQAYTVDVDTTATDDATINGGNARLSARVKLLGGAVSLFADAALNRNDILDPTYLKVRSGEQYVSLLVGGGGDWFISGKNGIGAQYMRVEYRAGSGGSPVTIQWANLGGTYWLNERTAVAARAAFSLKRTQRSDGPLDDGERALFLTLRTSL